MHFLAKAWSSSIVTSPPLGSTSTSTSLSATTQAVEAQAPPARASKFHSLLTSVRTMFSMTTMRAFVRSWYLRLSTLLHGATNKTVATNGTSPDDKGSLTDDTRNKRHHAATESSAVITTTVGLGLKLRDIFSKRTTGLTFSILVNKGTVSGNGNDNTHPLPDISQSSATPLTNSSTTIATDEIDEDDRLLLTQDNDDASSFASHPLPQTFHFAGFHLLKLESKSDIETSNDNIGPLPQTLTSCTIDSTASWREECQGGMLFGDATFNESNGSLHTGSSGSFELTSASDISASNSVDNVSLCSWQDSRHKVSSDVSSTSTGSVYSSVPAESIRPCSPVSWSHVICGSVTGSTSPEDYEPTLPPEASYVPSIDPGEPALLKHLGNTYIMRGLHGKGSFGKVMMAHDINNRLVAVKVIHKDKQYRVMYGRDILYAEKYAMERVTMEKMPWNVPLLESWADDKNVYFLMVCPRHPVIYRRR